MEFSGVHLNLFNVFKLNIGRFSCKDIYSNFQNPKRSHFENVDIVHILDPTSPDYKYSFYSQYPIPKGLYIDFYV